MDVANVPTVGSLFAGIGGFDLGFERCGMHTLWQVEKNDFCRAVLAKHFPQAQRFEDVCEVGSHNLEPVDLICGGFPCQDLSYAGKGAGIDGARSGLWAEYARIVGELRPRYVVVENVPALLGRGLERVLGDLAALGYDAEWDCLPASAFGAPHRRDRVWLIAYPNGEGESALTVDAGQGAGIMGDPDPCRCGKGLRECSGCEQRQGARDAQRCGQCSATADSNGGRQPERQRDLHGRQPDPSRCGPALSDADGVGRQGRSRHVTQADGRREPANGSSELADPQCSGRERREDLERRCDSERQETFGVQGSEVSSGGSEGGRPTTGHPTSASWAVEPDVGRVADGVPARVDRLSALGNALVPQIAEWIGHRILDFEAERVAA